MLGVGVYDSGKSARNAIKSGFTPAWVQITVKSEEVVPEHVAKRNVKDPL